MQRVLIGLLIAVLLMVLLPAVSLAYPNGYTSDNHIGVGGQTNIEARGIVAFIAYADVGGTVSYKRSTDQGVTWSDHTNFGSGLYPVVTATISGNVYVAYVTATGVTVQRSQDNGATWDPTPFATLATPTSVDTLAMTKNCDSPALCYQRQNVSNPDVYWSQVTAGTMTENNASHDSASDNNRNPRIAYDGTRYIVVWECFDNNGTDNGVWYRWSDAGSDAELVGNSSDSFSHADVAFGGSAGRVNATYAEWDSVNHYSVYASSYDGSVWSPPTALLTNQDNPPTPRVVPYTGGVVVHEQSSGLVQLVGPSPVTLYNSSYSDPPVSTCRQANNQPAYFAICDGGHLVIKRSDTVAPTAMGIQMPTYVGGQTFQATFNGVASDWNLTDATGNTNNGTPYYNGVVSVQPQYAATPQGPFNNLGNLLTATPWTTTVDASGWSDGAVYVRGRMTDTAGNVGNSPVVPVVVDRAPPTASITTDSTPNANGWRQATGFTVSGSDNVSGIDHYDYRIGAGNWTRCQGRVPAPNGNYDVYYRAVNNAGNSSGDSTHVHLQVDTTVPVVAISNPAGATWQADKSDHADIHATGQNNISGVTWIGIYLDGHKVSQSNSDRVAGHLDVSGYASGPHALTATCNSGAGVVATTTRTVTLTKSLPTTNTTYFAEGTTRPGFDEYLSILNPDTKNTANLTIDYQLETGQVVEKTATVNPQTRLTIHVPEQVPAGHDVSVKIHSDGAAVVAERPMYFNYKGVWDGGHTAVGVNTLTTDYYFAEGTTRQNGTDGPFDTYLTLQNPNDHQANVQITYMLGSGQNVQKSYAVAAHSRYTVSVNNDVGLNQDVSTKIHSDVPIAAERPMYFNYHNKWTGGHDVTGVTAPAKTWDFAEGTTRPNFDEWLTIQNPNNTVANVSVNYTTGNNKSIQRAYSIQPRSRYTVWVNGDVGPNQDVSAEVTSDVPIIAERPMYFDYNGWTGGSDVVGSTGAGSAFYFAEGTTRTGFEEYLTVLTPTSSNPSQSNSLIVNYLTSTGQVITKRHDGSGRITINVNADVGPNQDVAVHITADPTQGSKFVVERPMYFDYNGWTGGGTVNGNPAQ